VLLAYTKCKPPNISKEHIGKHFELICVKEWKT